MTASLPVSGPGSARFDEAPKEPVPEELKKINEKLMESMKGKARELSAPKSRGPDPPSVDAPRARPRRFPRPWRPPPWR